jgi:hydrogenase maturation protease
MQTLVLGLGNELLGDEGVGVHAARQLQNEFLSEEIKVLEVGTAILDVLPDIENAGRIVVLDAMKDGRPPGTVYKTLLDDCSGSTCIASMHGFDIFRVMSLTERSDRPPITVFGIEPELIDWSLSLSAPVAESLPYLIKAVLEELEVERRPVGC